MGSRRKEDWGAPGTQSISRVGEAPETPESTGTLQGNACCGGVHPSIQHPSILVSLGFLSLGLRSSSQGVEGSMHPVPRSNPVKGLCPLSFSEREGARLETPSMAVKSSGPNMAGLVRTWGQGSSLPGD